MHKKRSSRFSRVRPHWRVLIVATLLITVATTAAIVVHETQESSNANKITFQHSKRESVQKAAPKDVPAALPQPLFALQPTWQQDFTTMPNGQPDRTIWNFSTPATPIHNDEQQIYTDSNSNVRIEGGKLILEAHKEAHSGREYTSARIDTKDKFKLTYGKLEARMKVPKGAGTWPAFWLLSNDQIHTNKLRPTLDDWQQDRFYMHDGEIDILEHAGAYPHLVESTTHSFLTSDEKSVTLRDATDVFHTYGVEWTPDKLTFTIDGSPYHEVVKTLDNSQQWPFDHNMYVILNLAMGGEMGGAIDDASGPWRLEIEHLKYYPYTGSRE